MDCRRVIDEAMKDAMESYRCQIDEYIRLSVQPKPRLLPKFIWEWLLRHILVLEIHRM